MTKKTTFTAATQVITGQMRASRYKQGIQALNLSEIFGQYGINTNNGHNEL